jgi:hypothetical protein
VRLLERAVGAAVIGTEAVHGGMSPGPAAVLSLDDGRQVFAKAVAASVNSRSHALYAQEVDVLRVLPPSVPHAPLVARADHGDWIAVATTAANGGAVGPPWRSQHVAATADAVGEVARHPAPRGIVPAIDRMPDLDGWEALERENPCELDEFERSRLGSLVAMSTGWRSWTAGDRLVHLDVRCDNAVEHGEDLWLVDWSSACAGARWVDEAMLALDVVGSGHVGGPATAVDMAAGMLARLPYEATRFVVAWTGMLRRNALLPPGPGLPAFRGWQRERAAALHPLLERLVPR